MPQGGMAWVEEMGLMEAMQAAPVLEQSQPNTGCSSHKLRSLRSLGSLVLLQALILCLGLVGDRRLRLVPQVHPASVDHLAVLVLLVEMEKILLVNPLLWYSLLRMRMMMFLMEMAAQEAEQVMTAAKAKFLEVCFKTIRSLCLLLKHSSHCSLHLWYNKLQFPPHLPQ